MPPVPGWAPSGRAPRKAHPADPRGFRGARPPAATRPGPRRRRFSRESCFAEKSPDCDVFQPDPPTSPFRRQQRPRWNMRACASSPSEPPTTPAKRRNLAVFQHRQRPPCQTAVGRGRAGTLRIMCDQLASAANLQAQSAADATDPRARWARSAVGAALVDDGLTERGIRRPKGSAPEAPRPLRMTTPIETELPRQSTVDNRQPAVISG